MREWTEIRHRIKQKDAIQGIHQKNAEDIEAGTNTKAVKNIESTEGTKTTEGTETTEGKGNTKARRDIENTEDTGGLTAEERAARKRCLDILLRADRTEQQLRTKLKEKGFSSQAVEQAIAYAYRFHYLDDRKYAFRFVQQFSGRKSRRQLCYELEQKGVSEELIQEAIESLPDDFQEEAAYQLLKKKLSVKMLLTEKDLQKAMNALSVRGFPYAAVKPAAERIREEYEERFSE